MARWRAVNSSCMGTSVVRPLAVAHGRYYRPGEAAEKAPGAAKADTTDRKRNDQLSVRCNKKRNDQLSEKTERSAVGSQVEDREPPIQQELDPRLPLPREART